MTAQLALFDQIQPRDHAGPEPLPLVPDWREIPAGAITCPACGATYPGHFNGAWLPDERGDLHHWCSGGYPGAWIPATRARTP
jgi:hypothetical protein